MKKAAQNIVLLLLALFAVNWAAQRWFVRLDLTSERRYTLSSNTKRLMSRLPADVQAVVYLEGDAGSAFQRLKTATGEMLGELNVYTRDKELSYRFVRPSDAANEKARKEQFQRLAQRGLFPVPVTTRDEEGKLIQKIVFPWAQLICGSDTLNVNLLPNVRENPTEEDLNASVENLEFQFTDALRRVVNKSVPKIAFIEGHGELSEPETYDFTTAFNDYFRTDSAVFRGTITADPDILAPYAAIIIAKPQQPYTEQEKFIIDQYIMNGGKVLWLIDGVNVPTEPLTEGKPTVGVINEVNLGDQLFRYGVRINPVIVEDIQCSCVPVNIASEGNKPSFQQLPWFYSPLLTPSAHHPISRNLMPVRSDFASVLSLVSENEDVKKEILLSTSDAAHEVQAPAPVGMEVVNLPQTRAYFNQRNLPVAVAMSGVFSSVFTNRLVPEGVHSEQAVRTRSVPTRMVVVADGDVIRNEMQQAGDRVYPMPLGYDRCLNVRFGNLDFTLNAVLSLIDDEGWFSLRSREFKLRLLDKVKLNESRQMWKWTNTLLPPVLLALFGVGNYQVRRRRYR